MKSLKDWPAFPRASFVAVLAVWSMGLLSIGVLGLWVGFFVAYADWLAWPLALATVWLGFDMGIRCGENLRKLWPKKEEFE